MREYKPGAFGIILVHPYLTSQILDYQPADGQSQPRTLGIFIQFLETFKNPVALIGRNTATGIRHRQFQLLMLFVYGNRQFNRTGRGKFSGIGQQINQYLLQARWASVLITSEATGVSNRNKALVLRPYSAVDKAV